MVESTQAQDCCGVRVVRCGPMDAGCSPLPRRFMSSKERQEMLERYRDELKKELAGVEERIQDLVKRTSALQEESRNERVSSREYTESVKELSGKVDLLTDLVARGAVVPRDVSNGADSQNVVSA